MPLSTKFGKDTLRIELVFMPARSSSMCSKVVVDVLHVRRCRAKEVNSRSSTHHELRVLAWPQPLRLISRAHTRKSSTAIRGAWALCMDHAPAVRGGTRAPNITFYVSLSFSLKFATPTPKTTPLPTPPPPRPPPPPPPKRRNRNCGWQALHQNHHKWLQRFPV